MGRPREFDENEALERAMEVFWAKGYEAASLQDLTEAMGLSRSSFYETFGSKHALFLAAIERYGDIIARRLEADLAGCRPAREAIARVFEIAVETAVDEGDLRGCFLGNCAVEVSPNDPAAAAQVRAGLARIEDKFYQAVRRGQNAGEIPTERDARALARYLVGSLNGLRVTAKANPDAAALRDIVRIVLAALD
ncbi:MAG: TetR/AcrR family transcriptional regulator [Kiloniellaceae bacterium]